MNRYGTPNADAFEPGSNGRVLRNRLGITKKELIDAQEYEALVQAKYKYWSLIQDDMPITVEIIRNMHRDWLAGIYDFGGQLRTVELIAPRHGRVPEFRAFCPWPNILEQLNRFEENQLMKLTPCTANSVEVLAAKMAEAHAEFIVIHPFREGNGRIGRWITELMSLQAGFPEPDHGFASSRGVKLRDEYYRAISTALHRLDYGPLAHHFANSIRRGQRSFRP